jgi:amino acid transporter
VTYVLVAFAAVAFVGIDEGGIGLANPENADDVFATLGTAIFGDNLLGEFLEILLVFSILTSAAASTQTTVLPTARTMFAMGSYRALPPRFARLHPRYQTPSYATWVFGAMSVLYYVLLTLVSSSMLADSIAATGLLIAFYYGLTGFACVWFHRRQLQRRNLWTKGILPGLGAVMLLVVFVLSAIDYATPSEDGTSLFGLGGQFVVGIGALLLGGVVLLAYSRAAPSFFGGRTLHRRIAGPDVDRPAGGAVDAPGPFSDAFVPDEAVTEAIPVTVAASTTSSAPIADGEDSTSRRPRHRLYGLADPRQFDEP